jgi:hypothetical protein
MTVGGKTRVLAVGGLVPDTGNRFARDPIDKRVFVVSEDIIRRMAAPLGLGEPGLHQFELGDVARILVSQDGATRTLVRREGPGDAWSDEKLAGSIVDAAPSAVARLHRFPLMKYEERLLGEAQTLLRVEYFTLGKQVGFLELALVVTGVPDRYFVRTEQTRWYASVHPAMAEKLRQAAAAVLR